MARALSCRTVAKPAYNAGPVRTRRLYGFFVSFATIASGSTEVIAMLAFYAAVTWTWIWHSALLLTLRREVTGPIPARLL